MVRLFVFLAILVLSVPGVADTASAASDAGGTQPVEGSAPVVQETRGEPGASPPEANEPPVISWEYWQKGSTGTSRSDIARNFLLAFAAFIGLGFGIWRAWTAHRQAQAALSQARIAEQGQITDRFSTAVEQLGSEQLPVRLGGIYALWRLVHESFGRDVTSIIDILCAFVRHPPYQPADPANDEKKAATVSVRPDVEAIVTLIGDKEAKYRDQLSPLYYPDLSSANLTKAKLVFAELSNTGLMGATLSGAALIGANLSGANLGRANFSGAVLMEADLSGANLSGAILIEANFSGATLIKANLSRADLSKATNLTQSQLDSACIKKGGEPPKLPDGLKPPTNICD